MVQILDKRKLFLWNTVQKAARTGRKTKVQCRDRKERSLVHFYADYCHIKHRTIIDYNHIQSRVVYFSAKASQHSVRGIPVSYVELNIDNEEKIIIGNPKSLYPEIINANGINKKHTISIIKEYWKNQPHYKS